MPLWLIARSTSTDSTSPIGAADQRQQHVLDDELADQRPRRRAERLAHADLRGPLHDPADVDVDQVDRRQQHEQQRRARRAAADQLPALARRDPCGRPNGDLAGERCRAGLERRDDRRVALRSGSSTRSSRELNSSWMIGRSPRVAGQGHGVEAAHDLALVGVGLGGRVAARPDVARTATIAHVGDVLDDADDAEALAVGLERLADAPAGRRRAAARVVALITATKRASSTSASA